MFPRTDGNAVSALTLGSQGCWSTVWPKASPFKSGCACTHRSASTTCSGKVDAARIWATRESGYSAIGATNCCNCSGVCCACAGAGGACAKACGSWYPGGLCGKASTNRADDSRPANSRLLEPLCESATTHPKMLIIGGLLCYGLNHADCCCGHL